LRNFSVQVFASGEASQDSASSPTALLSGAISARKFRWVCAMVIMKRELVVAGSMLSVVLPSSRPTRNDPPFCGVAAATCLDQREAAPGIESPRAMAPRMNERRLMRPDAAAAANVSSPRGDVLCAMIASSRMRCFAKR
jgi:hypothetical protein